MRYFGWFKEIITERREEKWRVRKCVLYYYLEDDTIHISEPKVDNSGIPQGVFLRRMKVSKEDGGYLKFPDLLVGESVSIYKREFHIISCDDFTRKFLAENQVIKLIAHDVAHGAQFAFIACAPPEQTGQ